MLLAIIKKPINLFFLGKLIDYCYISIAYITDFVSMENETDEEFAQCSISLANNSMCHLKTFTHSKDELKLLISFELDEQKLLRRRVGLNFFEHSQICLPHEASFMTKYDPAGFIQLL